MFKLHWDIEQFMNSADELNELQIHGGYTEKEWKDECLTSRKFSVSTLNILQ